MIKSKAQMKKLYTLYKEGKVSYGAMMKQVHATPNMQNLPERITPKKVPKSAINVAI